VSRPRLLDLFSGAGGCSVGYDRAGFEVTGVDHLPHPDYPFELIVADAMDVAADVAFLSSFDVVHGSPPCPRHSSITPAHTRAQHPDHLPEFRRLMRAWGGVYVIENVVGAPMPDAITVCGKAMGLPQLKRHRLFESSEFLLSPGCACDRGPVYGVYGDHGDKSPRPTRPDGFIRWGKARDVAHAQEVMGIDWMREWDDLADAIPPAYTEFIGEQILAAIGSESAA
jgi:DNA (cytosine-5)-methyltransferase 1